MQKNEPNQNKPTIETIRLPCKSGVIAIRDKGVSAYFITGHEMVDLSQGMSVIVRASGLFPKGKLSPAVLENIHSGIRIRVGKPAAAQFVAMVADLHDIGAEAFIGALASLENAGFDWSPAKHPDQKQYTLKSAAAVPSGFHSRDEAVRAIMEYVATGTTADKRRAVVEPFLDRHAARDQIGGFALQPKGRAFTPTR